MNVQIRHTRQPSQILREVNAPLCSADMMNEAVSKPSTEQNHTPVPKCKPENQIHRMTSLSNTPKVP